MAYPTIFATVLAPTFGRIERAVANAASSRGLTMSRRCASAVLTSLLEKNAAPPTRW